jgi:hypothetical protein
MTMTPARVLLATVGAAYLLVACASTSTAASAPGGSPTPSARAASTTAATAPTTGARAAGATWTTYYHDAGRTGFSTDAPAAPAHVHRLWRSPVLDGDVYAEPLLVGKHVIVATENDSVYSLNAATGTVVWRHNLGRPVPDSSLPCGNVDPVGITSTPVVDAAAGRVYTVGMIRPAQDMLFALDLATGKLVASKSVDVPGSDPKVQNQRSALTLSHGRVYVPFGGRFGDCGDYHGRVTSVQVTAAGLGAATYYTLPTQREGGFWNPPGAATASNGSLYLASGNSSSSTTYDFGNSVVRLSADLKLLDSFAPRDWRALNAVDGDIGSSGPVLLPGGRVFQIGKSGTGYLLDAGHLGGIGGQLHSGTVCTGGGAWGGIGHHGDTMYVPCSSGVVQVTVTGDGFSVGWTTAVSTPGPTISTPAAVWTIETSSGRLLALDPASGHLLMSVTIGTVPSRFTTPSAGGQMVVAAADRKVSAYGD